MTHIWEVQIELGCGACPFEHDGYCLANEVLELEEEPAGTAADFDEVPQWCPLRDGGSVLVKESQ